MARQDYSAFIGRLPYASEILGIYRPMIGWNSARKRNRMKDIWATRIPEALSQIVFNYVPQVETRWLDPGFGEVEHIRPGAMREQRRAKLRPTIDSDLTNEIAKVLDERFGPGRPNTMEDWQFLDREFVSEKLSGPVRELWANDLTARQEAIEAAFQAGALTNRAVELRQAQAEFNKRIEAESAIAGLILDLIDTQSFKTLDTLFYDQFGTLTNGTAPDFLRSVEAGLTDPFQQFNPNLGLPGVSVSPLGIVHLFRQYFFEFGTFLGTPVGHVWLSPGSSVELIESSTRKATIERTVETDFESRIQTERTTKEQDEISEAIKRDNKSDSKLGFSTTVHQSWGTGNATATASMNLDNTQQLAREDTHKRMREQSEKISTDIRNRYQTSFKTVHETTDVSSKRYVLANDGNDLINYELRRKMRQVGVQVQDIGTYLCWETFVDEPGKSLGLADLVHIAKPADLEPQPDQKEVPAPPELVRPFVVTASWTFDGRQPTGFDRPVVPGGPKVPGYCELGTVALPIQIEPGYEIKEKPGSWQHLRIQKIMGDQGQRWPFIGALVGAQDLMIGVTGGGGRYTPDWDEPVTWTLSGEVHLVATAAKLNEIEEANTKIQEAVAAAKRKEQRETMAAFHAAVKERIEQASTVRQRQFEDLREEERTVVYRALIRDLMAKDKTTPDPDDDNYDTAELDRRHMYSAVINSIFDIDKMLYFVAPEWWEPRRHYSQYLGTSRSTQTKPGTRTLGKRYVSGPLKGDLVGARPIAPDSIVNWSDNDNRRDNYYITPASEPARLGSSLGWLLQLDGDDNRNRFLNAPWVRAVIPIRPGKEQAAITWLSRADVEGVDGLDAPYAEQAEYDEIRQGLAAAGIDFEDPPTIRDALRYLCLRVEEKHAESTRVALFPDRPGIPDEDKVNATPLDKVYEHGFYPLERSFRFEPREQPADTQDSTNFQCIAQWTEILPTDQVVPVPVAYDPETGQQL